MKSPPFSSLFVLQLIPFSPADKVHGGAQDGALGEVG